MKRCIYYVRWRGLFRNPEQISRSAIQACSTRPPPISNPASVQRSSLPQRLVRRAHTLQRRGGAAAGFQVQIQISRGGRGTRVGVDGRWNWNRVENVEQSARKDP